MDEKVADLQRLLQEAEEKLLQTYDRLTELEHVLTHKRGRAVRNTRQTKEPGD